MAVSGFYHTSNNLTPGKEHLYLLNRWHSRPKSYFRYCGKDKNILPYKHSKI